MAAGGFVGLLGVLGSPMLFGVLVAAATALAWLAFAPARPAQQVQDRLQGYLERVQAMDDAELQRSFGSRVILPGLPQADTPPGPAGAAKEHDRDAGDAGAGGRAGRPDRAGLRRRPAPGDGRVGRRRAVGARRPVRAVECAAVCGIRRRIRIHGARLLAPLEDQEAATRSAARPARCARYAHHRRGGGPGVRVGARAGGRKMGQPAVAANSAVPWRRCASG